MKRTFAFFATAMLSLSLFAQPEVKVIKPPVAKRVPKSSTIHGDTRVDNYA